MAHTACNFLYQMQGLRAGRIASTLDRLGGGGKEGGKSQYIAQTARKMSQSSTAPAVLLPVGRPWSLQNANVTSDRGWQPSAQDAAAGVEPVVGKLPAGTDMFLSC